MGSTWEITDPNYQDHNSNQIYFLYKVNYLETFWTFWTCSVMVSLIPLNVITLGSVDCTLINYLAEFVNLWVSSKENKDYKLFELNRN
jgi:hypothetical protein